MNSIQNINGMVIRNANWKDLAGLRVLEEECFGEEAWPLIDLISVLTLPGIIRLSAIIDGHLAGFASADPHRKEQIGWITTIGVRPQYQRQGVGKILLAECENRLASPVIRLCVARSNHVAIHIYNRTGYQQIDIWKSYYHSGEDALVLEKKVRLAVDFLGE
jgi:ribosomal-protein-alanine N-acetyltransferase